MSAPRQRDLFSFNSTISNLTVKLSELLLINNTCVSVVESITTKCLQEYKFIRAMGISHCNHREEIYQDTSKHQEYTLIITYDGAKCDSNKKENFTLIIKFIRNMKLNTSELPMLLDEKIIELNVSKQCRLEINISSDKICQVVHYAESHKFYKKWVVTPLSWTTWAVVALFILAVIYAIYSKLLKDRIIAVWRAIVGAVNRNH
ncbi:uncharacterized protein LOC100678229 isoform X2 [Nasonia vitripennis]|uniref:Uncharacterized protein n=1 Tax=Nasonia vitripennis TaxID=7425 RepID=A0A7M7HDN9_NASVI|nr:uncharacterized protein LOC100678229 isoform X2 [Nasonia vitripennis]